MILISLNPLYHIMTERRKLDSIEPHQQQSSSDPQDPIDYTNEKKL